MVVGIVFGIVLSVVAAVVFVGPLVVTHRSDLPLERAYGNFAVSVASRLNGGHPQSPIPQSRQAIQAGRLEYIGSCAECHGAKGDGKGVFGTATYPPATDLTRGDPKEMSDAQLFWIVKNGLSFTGMPAFGGSKTTRRFRRSLRTFARFRTRPPRRRQPSPSRRQALNSWPPPIQMAARSSGARQSISLWAARSVTAPPATPPATFGCGGGVR
jgi:mono/diheme cytochrome c family protein